MKNIKKWLFVPLVVGLLLCAAPALTTRITSYQDLVVSAAGAESRLTTGSADYNPGIPAPGTTALAPKDLLVKFGAGYETYANGVELVCYATGTENNTVEMALYGVNGGGAPEQIGEIIWILGTARHTSTTILWADTCTITADTHITTLTASDSGNNRIVKLTFDATGYRYLYAIAYGTTTGAATNITVMMRPY